MAIPLPAKFPVIAQDGRVWCTVEAFAERVFLPAKMHNSAGMTAHGARALADALNAAANAADEQERAMRAEYLRQRKGGR